MKITLENRDTVDFEKMTLVPAIVQDKLTGVILMQGFMNRDALTRTLETQKVTFFSRSKSRLWCKGETSGHFLMLDSVFSDCDNDSLLVLATAKGPTCHLGSDSCFDQASPELAFLGTLNQVIAQRKDADPSTSYTASLFAKDISRSAQKVGEEGVEVALAAMKHDKNELINESADLIYHLLVLLQRQDCDITEVIQNLKERHQ